MMISYLVRAILHEISGDHTKSRQIRTKVLVLERVEGTPFALCRMFKSRVKARKQESDSR